MLNNNNIYQIKNMHSFDQFFSHYYKYIKIRRKTMKWLRNKLNELFQPKPDQLYLYMIRESEKLDELEESIRNDRHH